MIRIFLLTLCAFITFGCADHDNSKPRGGSGSINLDGLQGQKIRTYYHIPDNFSPGSPVLIVMHGVKRNADWYRNAWRGLADRYGFLVLAPEFSKSDFPGGRSYNRGNMRTKDGVPVPPEEWSFNVVERVFDDARQTFGARRAGYLLFGHSAGAQFVHRMMTFMPRLRVERAVAANAGWYAMPDVDEPVPHGLKGSGITANQLRKAFGRDLTVLLGDADINPDGRYLNRSRGAMRQGVHRFSRGLAYFDTAKKKAAELDSGFAWTLEVVPGAGHSTHEVKESALRILLQCQ